MLTHVVLFTLSPETEPEAGDRLVRDALEQLSEIPGVRNLSAGRVMQRDSGFDVALSMQFDDEAALEAYRVHPVHQDYVSYLTTVTTGRQAYDFVQ